MNSFSANYCDNYEEICSRGLDEKLTPENRFKRTIISEALFCCHVIILVIFAVLCVIAKLPIILIIIILWTIHTWYFGGCIITITQRMVDGKRMDYTFFEDAIFRLTGKDVGNTNAQNVSYVLAAILIICLFIAMYYRYNKSKGIVGSPDQTSNIIKKFGKYLIS